MHLLINSVGLGLLNMPFSPKIISISLLAELFSGRSFQSVSTLFPSLLLSFQYAFSDKDFPSKYNLPSFSKAFNLLCLILHPFAGQGHTLPLLST